MIEFMCRVPKGYECSIYQVLPATPTNWWEVMAIIFSVVAAATILFLAAWYVGKRIDRI